MDDRPIIVWFRRDLRVVDNPALAYASRQHAPVVPIYAVDWEQGDRWAPGRAGRWWLERSLKELAASLATLGSRLMLLPEPAEESIPALARRIHAREVTWNRLYEPYARRLDAEVVAALAPAGVAWRAFSGALLFEPDDHFARSGRPFVQFTPFWRSCRSLPAPSPPEGRPGGLKDLDHAPEVRGQGDPARVTALAPAEWEPAPGMSAWEPGEAGAQARLARFLREGLAAYEISRDLPGLDATSRLSPHLHFGEIDPRQVWYAILEAAQERKDAPRTIVKPSGSTPRTSGGTSEMPGAEAFLRQLGWREFGHYLLFHFPHIVEQPFRDEFSRFPWQEDPTGLEAWKRGETGYPLVDAAMHQLASEGWVHNRPRMVAASFLTKDLLIPWQDGAAWFWDRLLDADLANNTLGWQWTAGSGPDAAPYFRVFNPDLQAARYDPDRTYIRAWHGEGPGSGREGESGPSPIVDHAEARARALAAFHGIRARPRTRTDPSPRG